MASLVAFFFKQIKIDGKIVFAPISGMTKSTLYRRTQRAKALGISIDQLPDGRGRHGNHVRGQRHHKWNDEILASHGYKKVRVGISHPLADPNGYAYEHVMVWVTANGPIPDGHVVHHVNEDKKDNRIENLALLQRGEHNSHHLQDMNRDYLGRFHDKQKANR